MFGVDMGEAIPAVVRYRLGKGLAKAGLDERLHRFIAGVECEDSRLVILFNHNGALVEFNANKEQFLAKAREFYKENAKRFADVSFIPKRIDAKVVFKNQKPKENKEIQKQQCKKCSSDFINSAKDPTVRAGFEALRAIIKMQEEESENTRATSV